jgi:mono/diheme cytochrome c family protein
MRLKSIVLVLLALAVAAAGALWLLTEPKPAFSRDQWQAYEQGGDAARGRIVFEAGGCASCHATPGQTDRLRLGGGLALKSPFGNFYVPNISPHPQDGVGEWKVVDLANAMQTGVSPGGAHYYPAFPYASFQRVRIEDIRDLMYYLRTLEPIAGKVRDHDLPFPFNVRRGLGLWKLLFLDGEPLKPDPAKDQEWNRGRYLVEGLGHCAECHSPRNFLGAIVADRRFAGGPSPDGRGRVPNITPDKTGIGSWSKADIVDLLTIGVIPGDSADFVGGGMAEVVKNTAELPKSDREAIAAYLQSLPPRQSAASASKP